MRWSRHDKVSEKEFSQGPSSRSEALTYRPVKSLEVLEQRLDNGEVVLTYPLTLRGWLASLATRLGLRSKESFTRKLQLDEMGSLTWSLLDGNRTVKDLVDCVCRRYKLNQRETEVAMTGFLRDLGKRGLIGFQAPAGREPNK
jgi:hypothetical protein